MPDSQRHLRLADLARATGVSISTVVRGLAGRPDVSPATRRRVCRIAARLGYTPNAIARSLVSQRTRTLGLLVNDCTNPFYSVLIEAIQQTAAKQGYAVVLGTSIGCQSEVRGWPEGGGTVAREGRSVGVGGRCG